MSTNTEIKALKKSLSEQRFATYLKKAKDDEILALKLYLYNLRLAESLLLPLNITEVTLRNTVDKVLTSKFGHDWYLRYHFRYHILNKKSRQSLDEATERIRQKKREKIITETAFKFWVNRLLRKKVKNNDILDEEKIRIKQDNRGKVIAETTFGLWSNLLTQKEYGDIIWGTNIYVPFPNLKKNETLRTVRQLVQEIHPLRNRIAHHEPILDMNIPDFYIKMIRLTQMQSNITAQWMEQHSTVNEVIRTRPK